MNNRNSQSENGAQVQQDESCFDTSVALSMETPASCTTIGALCGSPAGSVIAASLGGGSFVPVGALAGIPAGAFLGLICWGATFFCSAQGQIDCLASPQNDLTSQPPSASIQR